MPMLFPNHHNQCSKSMQEIVDVEHTDALGSLTLVSMYYNNKVHSSEFCSHSECP
jgi:hypothetical protein